MSNLTYTGKPEDLEHLGNIEEKIPIREIAPGGLIQFNSWMRLEFVLKNYLLRGNGDEYPSPEELEIIKSYVFRDLGLFKFKIHSGLGFSIFSKDMFNMGMWDKDIPVQRIYTLQEGIPKVQEGKWKSKNVGIVGSYCSGEKRVYDHENEAWLRYLNSERTNEDKVRYLNDFLVEE